MQVNNNQLGSQKSFGMAFHKPNPRGMSLHITKAIVAAKPKLDELSHDVDIKIILDGFGDNQVNVKVSGLKMSLIRRIIDFLRGPVVVTQKVFFFDNKTVDEHRKMLIQAATSAKEAYLKHPKVIAAEQAQKNGLAKGSAQEIRVKAYKAALMELDAAFPPKTRRLKFW